MKYIIERYPQSINDSDNDGRTPLHYAAVVKDDQHTYNTLISLGADEGAVDNVSYIYEQINVNSCIEVNNFNYVHISRNIETFSDKNKVLVILNLLVL